MHIHHQLLQTILNALQKNSLHGYYNYVNIIISIHARYQVMRLMTEKLSRPMYIIIFLMIVVETEGGLQTLDSECVDLN